MAAPSPVIASLNWMPPRIVLVLRDNASLFLRSSRGSGRTSCPWAYGGDKDRTARERLRFRFRWRTEPGAVMGVRTIGEAYQAGCRIHVRCAWGRREAMESVRGCLGKAELDLHTLIWTRGRAFPLTSPEARLECPICGSRRVSVIFDVPSEPAAMRIHGRYGKWPASSRRTGDQPKVRMSAAHHHRCARL
jgi:hypothetical protein